MAWEQARRSLLARLQDAGSGIAVRVPAICTALGVDGATMPTAIAFPRAWHLTNHMRPATSAEYAVRPKLAEVPEHPLGTGGRDTTVIFEVQFAAFGPQPDVLADVVAVHAIAFTQCLDALPAWSQANGGTIWDVGESTRFEFGEFDDLPTNAGFRAVFTLTERSTL